MRTHDENEQHTRRGFVASLLVIFFSVLARRAVMLLFLFKACYETLVDLLRGFALRENFRSLVSFFYFFVFSIKEINLFL